MKTANVRFYEELNDFLPECRRKVRFGHIFNGRPSVKDLIESIGVPHTEIDMILVNGIPVNFSYTVHDGDDISVYPVFESFDIKNIQHLRIEPLRNPKFVLDVHLGVLAKHMRMLGMDAKYQNNFVDEEIINISLNEGRTILTRNTGILKRNIVMRGYFVRNTNPEEQTKEVLNRFDLHRSVKSFSRCLNCNSLLKVIAKEKIIEKIPLKVRNSRNEFYICEVCNKVYWQGSHFENMNKLVERLLKA